jgi:hypothetical protein
LAHAHPRDAERFPDNTRRTRMNARTMLVVTSILLAACAGPTVSPQAPETTYEITVTRTWSEATNPLDWPGVSAHFTNGIGAAHSDAYAMFGAGRIATSGLEVLSQKGMSTPFDQELAAAQRRGDVGAIFTTGAVWTVGGTTTTRVTATDAFPLLSFAMMCAPSPDWFTGIPSLALKRNGQWIASETVTLYAWNSGTNNAMTYKAEKIAVNPFAPTALNDAPMFMKDAKRVPVGTATIRRIGG